MMEWVLLALLVAAIVIPIVLMFGFAGCDLIFKLKDPQPGPANLVAVAESRSAIKLTWDVTGFESARPSKWCRRLLRLSRTSSSPPRISRKPRRMTSRSSPTG